MKRLFRIQTVLAMLLFTACVTVNIYFPAAEVKKDAERVVKEVYGIENQPAGGETTPQEGTLLELFGPSVAHAQDYASLSNSVTRGIEQQLGQNYQQLAPYYASGNVGIDQDGFAVLRDKNGLDMQQIGQINRLVAADRNLKTQLYQEKARAAQSPDKVGQVQSIYADIWKSYAAPGTWVQNGGWSQK
ncbi:MAG: DUF1318 domain-containing protein [Desulfovibrionaceae bacterium]